MADALIRAVLHLEPDTLCDEEWALQVSMAEWVLSLTHGNRL